MNQTYTNLEIILVDDGSPDNCPAMCDEWAKKDERIRVIHKENGGLSSVRNAGLDVAKGEYIAFWYGGVEEQIDRLFRSSGLMRDKWDRVTGDGTYGTITIRNAALSCLEVYRPTSAARTSVTEDFENVENTEWEETAEIDAIQSCIHRVRSENILCEYSALRCVVER